MGNIILITGGARCGKSSFAQSMAENNGTKRLFIATCPVIDGEMDERIRLHKEDRVNRNWDCIEEEINVAKVISTSKHEVVLVDCLTLWLNNIIYSNEKENKPELDRDSLEKYCSQILAESKKFNGICIFVTGEIGLGVVPENPLARRYRDLLGWCNQFFAKEANEAYLLSCGLPLRLK